MAGVSERRGGVGVGGSTSEATSLPGGFSQPTVLIQPKTCRHDRTLVHCSCKEEIYIWLCIHVVYRGMNGVPKIARIFLLMQNKLAFTCIHSVKE